MKSIYLIGSLRNPNVPIIANHLEEETGLEIFTDWFAPGERADDAWKAYSQERGLSYLEALDSYAARHIYEFDKFHLDRTDGVVMVTPAGRSCHLELGYTLGRAKPGYILLGEEAGDERWDVMLQFATGIFNSVEPLVKELKKKMASPQGRGKANWRRYLAFGDYGD